MLGDVGRRRRSLCQVGEIRKVFPRRAGWAVCIQMPCLWANDDALLRQHLHESDVPVQAVAEGGSNVLNQNEASFEELLSGLRLFIDERNDLTVAGKKFIVGILDAMPAAIAKSKEAKKAALLDAIMPRIKSVGHVCPMLEFRQECIVCDVVSEYDAIEKDGKP